MSARGRHSAPRPGVVSSRVSALAATLVLLLLGTSALAAPRPRQESARYDLDILGFNDGDPYLLDGAAAVAVLADNEAVVLRIASKDWMDRSGEGRLVRVTDVVARYPNRSPAELVAVYRVDLDADGVPEVLLVPNNERIADGHRYAATILRVGTKGGYSAQWSAGTLPGERFRVVDIRDLNADGRPEVLLAGEAGRSGYYQFHQLIGRAAAGFERLDVRHVDSLHYVDLDRDKRVEVVLRERVGRRGPAYQWTYVDHLYAWTGEGFVPADDRFPRYHDEETLPTLIASLVDHFDAKQAILEEKLEAIESVRASVLRHVKRPSDFGRRLVPALAALQKDRIDIARDQLEALERDYPYDVQVLLGLAQVHASLDDWEPVLDQAIRALTVKPRDRQAWYWCGVAFSQLEERSSAVASFRNLVRLTGPKEEGLAFLRARRGEPGMEGSLQRAIDEALRQP